MGSKSLTLFIFSQRKTTQIKPFGSTYVVGGAPIKEDIPYGMSFLIYKGGGLEVGAVVNDSPVDCQSRECEATLARKLPAARKTWAVAFCILFATAVQHHAIFLFILRYPLPLLHHLLTKNVICVIIPTCVI